MQIAPQLFAWRQELGLTQQELAIRSGLAQPTIAALESGKLAIGMRRLKLLSQALNLSFDSLISGVPSPKVMDRFEIDTLCRALVAQDFAVSGVDKDIWRDLAALFNTRLGLLRGVPSSPSRISPSAARRRLDGRLGRPLVNLIDQRLRKFIPLAKP